ncbi:MAG: hypothetical protein LBB76_05720, partial [Azoarcus sp.]|nr:hypothetical protein [Azoarcus sp.]
VGSEDRYDGRVPASLGFNGIPGPTPPLDDPCKDKVLALGTTTGAVHATKLVCPGSSGVKGRLSWREIVE